MHISPGLDEHTSPQLFALHISWRVRIRQPFFIHSFIHVKFGAIYILQRGVFRSHTSFFLLLSVWSSGMLSSWVFLVLCRAFPIWLWFPRVSPVYSMPHKSLLSLLSWIHLSGSSTFWVDLVPTLNIIIPCTPVSGWNPLHSGLDLLVSLTCANTCMAYPAIVFGSRGTLDKVTRRMESHVRPHRLHPYRVIMD